jgi:hypothetical protein
MTVRNPECRVQVHGSRVSARRGTHGQVRALALRNTDRDNRKRPEMMHRG